MTTLDDSTFTDSHVAVEKTFADESSEPPESGANHYRQLVIGECAEILHGLNNVLVSTLLNA